jgi:hypothetical protein
MNLKVANLIAVQFGVFIGIMSWLAYSRLPSAEPRTAAETRERTAESLAAFAPVLKPGDERPQTVDYRADREGEQPAPAVHEYSAAAAQQYSALAAQQYYQQIAPRHYASSGLENSSVVADTPSYAEVVQEPEVVPDYPAPQTVAYVPSTQFIVYPQPQFVVFSNRHRFANRCRVTPHPAAHMTTTHRRPDEGESHVSGAGVVPRRNASAPSCRPTQEFGPGGHR